jgi:hypothetical protein
MSVRQDHTFLHIFLTCDRLILATGTILASLEITHDAVQGAIEEKWYVVAVFS